MSLVAIDEAAAENLTVACQFRNISKGNKSLEVWREARQ